MKKLGFVGIAGKQGPLENIKLALKQLDLSKIKGKSVLIKPNAGRDARPEQGYNTHPQAVEGVIQILKDAGASEIVIGESPLVGIDTFMAFKKAGISEVADRYNIPLIDFDARPPVKKNIPHPRILTNTKIAAAVYEYDILLSLPVAKTHMHTGVTLGIKNMKGCLYRHEKVRYHQLEYLDKEYPDKTLDSAISDLASILLPDITVIDGYIGMQGLGPSGGDPMPSDFALASWSPMAADIYGCILMGIDPTSIPHLNIISKRNKLSIDPKRYDVTENYEQYIAAYKQPPKEISMKFKDAVIYECEACSSCLSTLMLFLRRFEAEMKDHALDDGKFHIGIGKSITNAKEGTVFVGNCARKLKDKGKFVKGCPPVPSRIYEVITGEEPENNEPEVS